MRKRDDNYDLKHKQILFDTVIAGHIIILQDLGLSYSEALRMIQSVRGDTVTDKIKCVELLAHKYMQQRSSETLLAACRHGYLLCRSKDDDLEFALTPKGLNLAKNITGKPDPSVFDFTKKSLIDTSKIMASDLQKLQQDAEDMAAAIHYPECWDTEAFPTLKSAIEEIGCTAGKACTKEENMRITREAIEGDDI